MGFFSDLGKGIASVVKAPFEGVGALVQGVGNGIGSILHGSQGQPAGNYMQAQCGQMQGCQPEQAMQMQMFQQAMMMNMAFNQGMYAGCMCR